MWKRAGAAAVGLSLLCGGIAAASTSTAIGTFDPLTGSSGDVRTTMRLDAVGFPEASVRSTSRAGQVGPQSGASTWFGADTPPGQVFGSSRDLAYLNLRPRVDATTPSTTTYTFERPTPQGWGFVLGDIDADEVRVSAVTADGDAATIAELGFQGTFNLCDASPRPPGCSTSQVKDQPTWDAPVLRGNDAAADTYGATGWFRPTTSLESLTFRFTGRSGAPVFQTWFGVVRRDITGTVTGAGECGGSDREVRLLDRDGVEVATTDSGPSGAYAFAGVAASDGWRVELGPLPDGCLVDGPRRRDVDTSTTDSVADLAIREVVPAAISGQVRTTDDEPLAGVTVTITGPGGSRDTTTDRDGRYVFDENAAGEYTLAVQPPDGYEVDSAPQPVTVPDDDETPLTGRDFELASTAEPPAPEPSDPEPSDPPGSSTLANPSTPLPDTGGSPLWVLIVAVVGLGAGYVLLRASRRGP